MEMDQFLSNNQLLNFLIHPNHEEKTDHFLLNDYYKHLTADIENI